MKNLKLSTKIITGLMLLSALALGAVGFGVYSVTNLNNRIDDLKENQFALNRGVLNLNVDVMNWNKLLLEYVEQEQISQGSEIEAQVETHGQSASEGFETLLNNPYLSSQEKERLSESREIWNEIQAHKNEVLTLTSQGERQEARKLITNKITPKADKISEHFNSLGKIQNKSFESAITKTDSLYQQTRFSLFAFGGVSLILSIFFIFFIRHSIKKMMSQIPQLVSASRNVFEASSNISEASQNLSSSSQEQASSVEETSSSLEEINGMIENNTQNAEKSSELAENVRSFTDEKIQKLVGIINEVGKKTEVIDEIVFQTKLLSFNASVEAERAGEHGRGFAVVAQEVGNLAQMSGKAAEDITDIVKKSRDEAETIAEETRDQISSVSDSAKQIVNASREQSSGVKQITVAVDQINKATQENSRITEETAASSEELNGQAKSLDRIIGELSMLINGANGNSDELASHDQSGGDFREGHEAKKKDDEKVLSFTKNKKKEEHKGSDAPVEKEKKDHSIDYDEVKKAANDGPQAVWDKL